MVAVGTRTFWFQILRAWSLSQMCHVSVTAATLKEIGQFVVNTNTLGKEGFVSLETWLVFFILEKAWGLAAWWSHRLCSKTELFDPKLPFLSWKEGEEPGATRWRSRTLQRSRTIPQPSPMDPSWVFTETPWCSSDSGLQGRAMLLGFWSACGTRKDFIYYLTGRM